jgi:hypothetical protein
VALADADLWPRSGDARGDLDGLTKWPSVSILAVLVRRYGAGRKKTENRLQETRDALPDDRQGR